MHLWILGDKVGLVLKDMDGLDDGGVVGLYDGLTIGAYF